MPLFIAATAVGTAAAIALAVVIIRFNRKRLLIARCASEASGDQLERIYVCVEGVGTLPSNGYVLARTNRRTIDTVCLIPIPKSLQDFPWAGKVVEVLTDLGVDYRFVESPCVEPTMLGRVYRLVAVPRYPTKSGNKEQNTFSPDRFIAESAELHGALAAVCPKYPKDLLAYLLCVGRESFEFEPIDQARIGTSPAWVQDPDPQSCDQCRKRMCLVLQVPGTIISQRAFHRGTFYLFGCKAHPAQTKAIGQFT